MLKSLVGRFGECVPLLDGWSGLKGLELLEREVLVVPLAHSTEVGEAAHLDRGRGAGRGPLVKHGIVNERSMAEGPRALRLRQLVSPFLRLREAANDGFVRVQGVKVERLWPRPGLPLQVQIRRRMHACHSYIRTARC